MTSVVFLLLGVMLGRVLEQKAGCVVWTRVICMFMALQSEHQIQPRLPCAPDAPQARF